MSPPRRALIAITSAKAELFEGGGHTTGVFIGEALHPFNVLTAAGFEVDLASEKGVYTEDWLSLQPGFLTEEERKQYETRLRSQSQRRRREQVRRLLRFGRPRGTHRLPSRKGLESSSFEHLRGWRYRLHSVRLLSPSNLLFTPRLLRIILTYPAATAPLSSRESTTAPANLSLRARKSQVSLPKPKARWGSLMH
jgi:hypothetical protein